MKFCFFGTHRYSCAWTRQNPYKMTWNNNIHPRKSLEWTKNYDYAVAFKEPLFTF